MLQSRRNVGAAAVFVVIFMNGINAEGAAEETTEAAASAAEPSEVTEDDAESSISTKGTDTGAAESAIEAGWMKQIVVTADRLETPREKVTAATTVLKGEDIRRRGYRTVGEALRFVPGLDVRQTGGEGHTTTVFLRGSKSSHTKVFVDGVDMSDAASTSRLVDFGTMDVEDIEKIEIIRGPQSVLYGSDAIGGVISIITRRGEGEPGGYVKFEGGSHGTFREAGSISGAVDWFDFRLTMTRDDIRGISAASKYYGNSEKDAFRRTTVGGKFGARPAEWLDITSVFKFSGYHLQIDDFGGWFGDDRDRWQEGENFYFRPQVEMSLFDDRWTQKFGASFSKIVRDSRDNEPVNPAAFSAPSRYRFISRIYEFDWQHTIELHETNTLTFGAEMGREQSAGFSSGLDWSAWPPAIRGPESIDKARRSYCGYYLQDKISLWDRVNVAAGFRIDTFEYFPTAVTWRVAPSVWIPETQTKLRGAIGTGFKAPSLYQLHDPQNGNPNLDAEESYGWDVGIEQYLFDKRFVVGATWFENTYTNLIDWVLVNPWAFTGQYRNVGEAFSHGLELEAAWEPIEELRFEANYTYTKARDLISDVDLASRPRHKCSFHTIVRPVDDLSIDLGCRVIGKRREAFGPDDNWNATYMVWDLSGTYDITENLQVFGSWKNMFDEKYEDVWGYGTYGCSVYGGVKVSF